MVLLTILVILVSATTGFAINTSHLSSASNLRISQLYASSLKTNL